MKTHQDVKLTTLIDRFDLLERRLKREIDADVPLSKLRETGIKTEEALLKVSAYKPRSVQGWRIKFRFLLTKLVNRYPDAQNSEIVKALFAMGEGDVAFGAKVYTPND